MCAFYIAAALVKPAAGVIYEAARVCKMDLFCQAQGIELSPALVEKHPETDTGNIIKLIDELHGFFLPLSAGFFGSPGKEPVEIVTHPGSHRRKKVWQIADQGQKRFSTSVDHILPDDHAQAVTVIIPAHGFHLYVLADHIKAQLLHGTDIENQGLVRGRCVKAFRPVALIQYAIEKVGLIVEEKLWLLFFIQSQGKFPHGKIAVDGVGFRDKLYLIKERILRAPGTEIRQPDITGKSSFST